jgi:hypothetical protein
MKMQDERVGPRASCAHACIFDAGMMQDERVGSQDARGPTRSRCKMSVWAHAHLALERLERKMQLDHEPRASSRSSRCDKDARRLPQDEREPTAGTKQLSVNNLVLR